MIEVPLFGFSEFYPGIQLADYCAGAIDGEVRHRRFGQKEDEFLIFAFSRIVQRIAQIVDLP
jgi:hypothetical protein